VSAETRTENQATWVATRTPGEAGEWLRTSGIKQVAIVTHAKPDGDAVGSTLALARALGHAGVGAMPWYIGPMPRWYESVRGRTPASVVEVAAGRTPESGPEPDAVVVADTGSWMQVEDLGPWVKARRAKTMIVDHHLSGDADMSDARVLVPTAAAAAEIMAEVCCRVMGVAEPAGLPLDVAEPLYLGLATDTGWFRFSNTSPRTLRLAASLRETGVDVPRLFQWVEQQDRVSRLRLLARALSSLELLAEERVALMSLTRRDFEASHGDAEDTTGFASDVLSVASVQVGILLTETTAKPGKPPLTKASLRSKPGAGAVDVAALTRSLGGGGHARAAGVKLAMPLAEARAALVAAVHAALGSGAGGSGGR
jgi:phosphoesterase RecJ-like protein